MQPDAAPPDRARVDAFVARHFSLRGTLRLHRNALGLDLLRAPANVALAPVFLATRLAAPCLRALGLRRSADWLARRRIFLPTAVSRAVEEALCRDLLGPHPGDRAQTLIRDYTAVRGAVAEICTTGVVLVSGFALFHVVTPGLLSLAPVLSGYAARARAIADFPLGDRLGGLWYGLFPVDLSLWWVVAAGLALAMAASLVTAFAGILADPVQAALGIHRRRLLRLLSRIEAADTDPALAHEHLLARLADLSDVILSLIRALRP